MTDDRAPESVQDHPMMRPVQGPRPGLGSLAEAWYEALGIPAPLFTHYPTVEAR